jgi:aminoglycoside phosphotransferase (APT) family kinase protein
MSGDRWRALVDLGKLQTWMGRSRPWTRPENPGGTQNILLQFERDGRSYVLRRSARGPRGDGNATNRREARVLGVLAGSDVRIPA